ncbi:MAG: ABC transporter ATP-binding protein [Thermoplasmata archaeon]
MLGVVTADRSSQRKTLRAPAGRRGSTPLEEGGTITEGREVIVRAQNLGFAYRPDRFAVRGLNFELYRGQVFGLLGRNGAGKTTTVRLLTTLLSPTEGGGTLFGKDLRSCGRAERARIGVVLQSESLDFVTVEENLRLYAFLWGVGRETAKARAEEMLELFELGHNRKQKPWALSGGERRRFQVARELMHDMELLFLDEPTVGLDALTRSRILDYLAGRARAGLSIVFTTHILHEADRLCQRIGVMHEGHLLTVGSPAEIKRAYSGARTVEAEYERPLTAEESEELQAILAQGGEGLVVVEGRGALLVFRARNAESLVAGVVRWAGVRGIAIERVGVSESTLEDAFVHLVSGPPSSGVPLTLEEP